MSDTSTTLPSIPLPTNNVDALYDSVMALKQSLDMLAGQTNNPDVVAIRVATLPSAIANALTAVNPTGDAVALTTYLNSLHEGAVAQLHEQIVIAQTSADNAFNSLSALLSSSLSDLNATDADLQVQINSLAAGTGPDYGAAITSEAATRASADSALAIRADTMEASAAFDPYIVWNFESTVDGWSGSTLTVAASSGTITVTATGSDPQLISPDALGIDGSKFNRIRLRIRRKAGTTWDGICFFSTTARTTFMSGYYKSIPTPTAAVDAWFLIDLDMHSLTLGGTDWKTSTIKQIRLDFATGGTDAFEIDWIAIGRMGAGSTALITQEAAVRVTADTALSGRIDTVTTAVASNASAITTIQTSRSTVDATVAATLNTLTAVSGGIHSYSQSTAPTSPNPGDVWIDTSSGSIVKYYQNGAWVTSSSGAFVGAAAAISQEAVTRTTADSALSSTISSLTSTVAGNTSAITSEAATRATNDSTLAGAINTVQANVDTQAARVDNEIVARANADSALSSTLTAVQAQSNAGLASGSYRLTAVSASSGVAAEFAVQVAATSGGTYSNAGMNLQVLSGGGSRIVFNTDQFIVKNSSSSFVPFAIVSSSLYANFLTAAANVTGLGSLATMSTVGPAEVVLGDPSNMVLNGDFLNGSSAAWGFAATTSINTSSANDIGGQWRAVSRDRDAAFSNPIQATPGDVIYLSAMCYNNATERANLYAYCTAQDGSGGTYIVPALTDVKGAWTKLEGTFTMPSGCNRFQVLLQTDRTGAGNPGTTGHETYWGKVVARRATSSALTAVGVASNMLYNATFNSGTESWAALVGSTGLTQLFGVDLSGWILASGHTLWHTIGGTPASGSNFDIYHNLKYPVTPGQHMQAYGYLGMHRCQGYVTLQFFDSSGTYITEFSGNSITEPQTGGATLQGYGLSQLFCTAPSNAHTCLLNFRAIANGTQADPYMFLTRPFLGAATSGQTEISPWAPGNEPQFGANNQINSSNVTTFIANAAIQDAQIANLAANKITTTSLSAISANLGTVTTGKIQSATGGVKVDLTADVMEVTASRFTIKNADGATGVAPFSVTGGVTYITEASIQRGVVTQAASAVVVDGSSTGSGLEASVAVTLRQGASVTIIGAYQAFDSNSLSPTSSPYNASTTVYLKKDTTTLTSRNTNSTLTEYGDSVDSGHTYRSQSFDTTLVATFVAPTAATYTFKCGAASFVTSCAVMVVEYNK